MKQYFYHVIGVMSGTSLDGIDLCEIEFHLDSHNKWTFEILQGHTIGYSSSWIERLKTAHLLCPAELEKLNEKYTVHLASVIIEFVNNNKITHIDAVCSHGHTVLHRPDLGYTLQIGNLPLLCDLIGLPVVCDFRVQDVALKGQGAPLVPIGDRFLFENYQACLNLGGFANISFESPQQQRIAFDVCPVNVLLNAQASRLGRSYDKEGMWAREGKVDIALLEALNSLDFYVKHPPKSLGIEWVQQYINPIIDKAKLSPKDVLATLCKHIAIQIELVTTNYGIKHVLVSGGGAHNKFLFEQISSWAKEVSFVKPNENIIEFKEAVIFGFLGVLRLRNQVNVLQSVTGASHDHCAGLLYYPFSNSVV